MEGRIMAGRMDALKAAWYGANRFPGEASTTAKVADAVTRITAAIVGLGIAIPGIVIAITMPGHSRVPSVVSSFAVLAALVGCVSVILTWSKAGRPHTGSHAVVVLAVLSGRAGLAQPGNPAIWIAGVSLILLAVRAVTEARQAKLARSGRDVKSHWRVG
jgi:hypothetical protein